MHELAITQSVVEAVTERTGSAPVRASGCGSAGSRGVVPEAMRFCFDLVDGGHAARGCRARHRAAGGTRRAAARAATTSRSAT